MVPREMQCNRLLFYAAPIVILQFLYCVLSLTSHFTYFPVIFTFVPTKRICPNLSLVRICRRIQGISAKVQPACCVALPHPPPALPASSSFVGTAVLHGNVPRHEEARDR